MASNTIIQYTSSSSSSSLSHLSFTYDVFLSFRGEDTRNNFIAFLLQAFSKNGIGVFKDDEDLKKGECIAPVLLQAIQDSRLFVVVFSKNYASSTWCLRELVHICYRIQTSSGHVLPIFYDVDPSEVRKQTGNYEKAFAKHEKRLRGDKEKMEEVERWRQALTQVANLSGWDIRNKSQAVIIDEIVQMIEQKLGHKYSSLPKDNLVGMDSRVEELIKFLHSGSGNDVRVVGICGMAGIGKTTLLRALWERISNQYDSCCFIENVNNIFQKFGALGVLKQLLSQSLNEKNLEIHHVSHGTDLTWTRLRHKRALIVLDHVHDNEQLNMFSGNRESLLHECLGGGSRIIIISRDKEILRKHGVDDHDLYLVQPLDQDEACHLFCRNSFKRNYIISGYENLTGKILSKAQGHPLVIKVIGCSLFDKNFSQWEGMLVRLNDYPCRDFMDMLRISYDDLCNLDKQIFLDIACFVYDEEECHRVSEILDFRGLHPEVGLDILVNKSLIDIKHGLIFMHNLLRDLGQLIVKEEYPREPSKWSRLWDYQDFQKVVMSDNMAETNIEVIVIPYIPDEFMGTTMTVDALSKLRNLKLFMFPYDFKSSGSINDLSNEIGYIQWYHYPSHCLPQRFQPHKLVELILSGSNIEELWDSTKPLHNLKHLDLSHSEKLVKLQNFGDAINLKILNLKGCIRLKQIDLTSGFPGNLTDLNLEDCRSLINLPHFSNFLKKLTHLNLKNCKSLVSLPKNILELNSLEYLNLFGCSQLYKNQLLKGPRDAEHSRKLCIRRAPTHSQSSSSIFNKIITWLLPFYSREKEDSVNWLLPSLSTFSCMRQLDLSFCNLLQVPDAIGKLHSLERLSLKGNNFAVLPNLKELTKLIYLNLQHCKRLKNLPELPSHTDVPSQNTFSWSEIDERYLGLNTFNCPELCKRKRCISMCIKWIIQIVKAHHPYNYYDFDGVIWYHRQFSSIIPGSEVPRWFNNQHACTNNSIRIDKSHIVDDNNWAGVAICAIFVVRSQRTMSPPKTQPDSQYYFPLGIPLFMCADLVTNELDHLLLFYFPYYDCLEEFCLEIGDGKSYGVEVKKYGCRVVCKDDLQLSNFTMMHAQNSLPKKRKLTEIEENE